MKRRRKQSSRLYYADECIPLPSVTYLRSRGFSIIHAYEKGYTAVNDLEQLKISKKLNRILIALDKDFWQRRKFNLSGHPGVIVLKSTSSIPSAINKVAEKVLRRTDKIKLKESILYASKDRIRRWGKNGEDEVPWKK